MDDCLCALSGWLNIYAAPCPVITENVSGPQDTVNFRLESVMLVLKICPMPDSGAYLLRFDWLGFWLG